ncbi:alpha/beta hydrolase family esterase [Pseudonocardia spinosispora]|uniref:alpha/beta hydrolase family esterase n=1 Tax=Pseudonocardia spinosispora TaxID=103441 RepID=UPI00048DA1EF|nr:hypothetical protein [Pseudonocardia spinosispora]
MSRAVRAAGVVLAAALLTACGSPAESSASAGPRSAGCGHATQIPTDQTVQRTVESGGLSRTYTVHLPPSYQQDTAAPLVLSFHGHKRTSAYQEKLSEFSTQNVIAVYPQGLVGTDGETAWTGAPYSAPADDVRFTGDLLDQLEKDLCVDPSRIYATGKSNGGGFVGTLACRMSDRFAAFAPVSGAFYAVGGPCNPVRPTPILDFHGTADETIPYQGSAKKGLPSIPDWLTAWAQRNGCGEPPSVRAEHDDVVKISEWPGCKADLIHYRIEGLGHDWPSTHPNLDSDKPTVLNATPIIMAFFAKHTLNQPPPHNP